MSQFLAFRGAGFRFVLPTSRIVELFDAMASTEALNTVLSGEQGDVYWRGKLARMLDVDVLLGLPETTDKHCYIVCSGNNADAGCYILKVAAIDELIELRQQDFRPLNIANDAILEISRQVVIVPGQTELHYLLREFADCFEISC